jgi:hypothetical protein
VLDFPPAKFNVTRNAAQLASNRKGVADAERHPRGPEGELSHLFAVMAFSAKRDEEPIRRLFPHRALVYRIALVEPQMCRIAWWSSSAAEAGEQLYPFQVVVLPARIWLTGVRREVFGDA